MNVTALICGDPTPSYQRRRANPGVAGVRDRQWTAPSVSRCWNLDAEDEARAIRMRNKARGIGMTNRQISAMCAEVGVSVAPSSVSLILNARYKARPATMRAMENAIEHAVWEAARRTAGEVAA